MSNLKLKGKLLEDLPIYRIIIIVGDDGNLIIMWEEMSPRLRVFYLEQGIYDEIDHNVQLKCPTANDEIKLLSNTTHYQYFYIKNYDKVIDIYQFDKKLKKLSVIIKDKFQKQLCIWESLVFLLDNNGDLRIRDFVNKQVNISLHNVQCYNLIDYKASVYLEIRNYDIKEHFTLPDLKNIQLEIESRFTKKTLNLFFKSQQPKNSIGYISWKRILIKGHDHISQNQSPMIHMNNFFIKEGQVMFMRPNQKLIRKFRRKFDYIYKLEPQFLFQQSYSSSEDKTNYILYDILTAKYEEINHSDMLYIGVKQNTIVIMEKTELLVYEINRA